MSMNRLNESSMSHLSSLEAESGSALCSQLQALQKSLVTDPQSTACQALLGVLEAALLKAETPLNLALRILKLRKPPTARLNPMTAEEAKIKIAEIQRLRVLAAERCTTPGSRKLDKYRQSIEAMHKKGASTRTLQTWLRRDMHCNVSQATVARYVKTLANHATN